TGLDRADPIRAHAYLAGRLLTRDVQHARTRASSACGHVQYQGGFADAGFAGQQHHGTRHDATTEYTVELADSSGPVMRLVRTDFTDRACGGGYGGCCRGARTCARCPGLDDCAPGLALAAPTHPLRPRPSTLGAVERGTVRFACCHALTLTPADDIRGSVHRNGPATQWPDAADTAASDGLPEEKWRRTDGPERP